ncbi:MAG: response regulator [Acidobacteria bacterium]|nr:response regulator [Acidobacteriota bacterium]
MVLKSLLGGAQPEREPSLRDGEQILAWLEELARVRTPLALRLKENDPFGSTVKVELVSEEKETFTLSFLHQPPGDWKVGQVVHLNFPLDGQRFRATAKFAGLGGYLQREFKLPEAIFHAERRGLMRTRFSRRERPTVAVLEELFQGLGLSGPILNISMGGLAFRVDRVMDIKQDRRIQVKGDLLGAGRKMALIRIQDLPHTPTLECSATIAHFNAIPEGVVAGLTFEGMGSLEMQYIAKLLSQRLPTFGRGFPRKRRRGEQEANPDFQSLEEEDIPAFEEPSPPSEVEDALSDRELLEIKVAMRAPDRLSQLRKRTRQILVVHPDELDRAILTATLQVEGYRGIHEARSLVQALDVARRHNLNAILVGHRVGPHEGLEVIAKLKEAFKGEALVAVLVTEGDDVKAKLALKGGRVEGLVPFPVDFDGILKPMLENLLGLGTQSP